MNNIGKHLKLLRTDVGMTQDEVAERLSVTRQAISSYETGRTQPDIEMLTRMAEIYNTDLETIVYGDKPFIKYYESVRRWAYLLLGAVVLLTILGSGLQWAASRFYPIQTLIGESASEARPIIEKHVKVIQAGEGMDALNLWVSFLGELGIAIYAARRAADISFKKKGLYTLALAVFPLMIGCIFGLSRYSLSLTNYMIQPFGLAVQAVGMLLVNVLICRRKVKMK